MSCGEATDSVHSSRPIGNDRIRTRVSSRTTTAPVSNAPSTPVRLARSIAAKSEARRPRLTRNKITEGFASRRSARSVLKSVSADTRTRSSEAARASTVASSAAWRPYSRMWIASWVDDRSASANRGLSALSMRNLTVAEGWAVHAPGALRPQREALLGYRRLRDPEIPRGFPSLSFHRLP